MRHLFTASVAVLLAAVLTAASPPAPEHPAKPRTPSPLQLAKVQVRKLVPEARGQTLALVGHVTPAMPLASRKDPHRLGLQIGRGKGPPGPAEQDLRWDSVNNQLTLPGSPLAGTNPAVGPYAGMLFTIRENTRYIAYCAGTGDHVKLDWLLALGPQYSSQHDAAEMQAGSFAFVTSPISGSGGYADLRFGFGSPVVLNECWLFSFQPKA